MADNQSGFEQGIREHMGSELLYRLPVEGKAVYNGELTIEKYRGLIRGGDNLVTAYLTLNKLQPEVARVIVELSVLGIKKQTSIDKKEYEEAAALNETERILKQGLIKLISILEPETQPTK